MQVAGESSTVSFRLRGALLEGLQKRAEEQGVSAGELARRLVIGVLQDEDRSRVLLELETVRQELSRLRSDVATSLEMVLLNVGSSSPDEIRAWVGKNMRR
jgi:hypothetical protein